MRFLFLYYYLVGVLLSQLAIIIFKYRERMNEEVRASYTVAWTL